jgi:uncharacterized protein YggE
MNTRTILPLVIALFAVPGAFAQAPPPPQISVTGSAEVKVAPDEIHLGVGVETRHETMAEAKRQNDELVTKVLAFIRRSGVADKDVQTDFLSIDSTYNQDSSRIKAAFYVVSKSIEIRFTEIKGFEEFLSGLLTSGVTTVHGIDFRTTQIRKHRDTARAMAIRAAREKADAMAAELGVKRGRVYSITANDWSGWSGASGGWRGGRGAANYQNSLQNIAGGPPEVTDSTFSIGQIGVSASVSVSFLIE